MKWKRWCSLLSRLGTKSLLASINRIKELKILLEGAGEEVRTEGQEGVIGQSD